MTSRSSAAPPLLADESWQMSLGERFVIEGLASHLEPRLAIEIGSAAGGSLRCIARHSGEVHSFDLIAPDSAPPNVVLHTGDSHALLPQALEEFAAAGRTVDFALVDGDHSAAGVCRDIEDLLASPAVADTVIVAHDAANGVVREGLESVDYRRHGDALYVDLDFVPGYVFSEGPFAAEVWGGLGVIVVGPRAAAARPGGTTAPLGSLHPAFDLLTLGWAERARRDDALARLEGLAAPNERAMATLRRELAAYEAETERLRGLLDSVLGSASWRITAPFRRISASVRSKPR